MRRVREVFLSVLVIAIGAGAGAGQEVAGHPLEGQWTGTLAVMGAEIPIRVRFGVEADSLVGTLDAQGATGLPLVAIELDGDSVRFTRVASTGTLEFVGMLSGAAIDGGVLQGVIEGTFRLARAGSGQNTGSPVDASVDTASLPLFPVGDGTGRLVRCSYPGLTGDVLCGTYEVPENRTTGEGRHIDLAIVVLPAQAPVAGALPLVVLAGGPGGAATQMAPSLGIALSELRRRFDIILVDQRGTGASNPLSCPYGDVNEMARAVLQVDFTPSSLAVCRESLEADLTQYTTPVAVEDLADVIRALGHEAVNVYGLSYGTRVALVLARRHPELVRSMVLQGVAPLSLKLPANVAADAQASWDGVVDDCEADAACAAANPGLRSSLAAILQRLAIRAVDVPVSDPVTGAPGALEITDDIFTGGLRTLLYMNALIQRVPGLIAAAAGGDFGPFANAVMPLVQAFGQTLHFGAYLSVVCTEDVPFNDPDRLRATSRNTFLGDRMVRHHAAACRDWPMGSLPAGFSDPVTTDIPTLLFSGTSDPVTPPHWAEAASRTLRNSRHIVVPRASHSDSVGPCEDGIAATFLETGDLRTLDATCVAQGRLRQYGGAGH